MVAPTQPRQHQQPPVQRDAATAAAPAHAVGSSASTALLNASEHSSNANSASPTSGVLVQAQSGSETPLQGPAAEAHGQEGDAVPGLEGEGGAAEHSDSPPSTIEAEAGAEEHVSGSTQEGVVRRPCCAGKHLGADTPAPAAASPPGAPHLSPGAKRGGPPVLPLLLLAAVAVPAVAWVRRYLNSKSQHGSADQAKAKAKAKGPKHRKGADGRAPAGDAAAATGEPAEAPPPSDALPTLVPLSAPLLPPPNPPSPLAPLPLASLRLAASEEVDVAGAPTTHGLQHLPSPPLSSPAPTAAPVSSSAPIISRLVSAGASCITKTTSQPLAQELLGSNVGSPLNQHRAAGGGCTGAAVAVATGAVDIAVCIDAAGEARVPASCCGVYALRPTPGVLGPVSSEVGALPQGVAVIARDTQVLTRVAETLRLPGNSNLRGEILKFVVAQDLFELCAPELQPATLAVKKAILRWAGADQAGAVQLVQFLATNASSWREVEAVMAAEKGKRGEGKEGEGEEREVRLSAFVEAAIAAVRVLSLEERWRGLSQEESSWLEAATAAAAPAPAAAPDARGEGEPEQNGQGQEAGAGAVEGQAQGTAEVGAGGEDSPSRRAGLAELASLARPSVEAVRAATALVREVSEVLRQTVKADTILVLPALPFPPPRRPASGPASSPLPPIPSEHSVFSKLARCFNAFAVLGGCPSITCPVGNLRDGSPVAVTLVGVAKCDQRLLAAAGKLVPMIHDCFHAVKEEITALAVQERQQQQQEAEAAGAGAKGAGQAKVAPAAGVASRGAAQANGKPSAAVAGTVSGGGGGGGAGAAASGGAVVDVKRVEKAEKFKAKGNECYAAGKHLEAVTEYTKAINTNPHCPVYYNNRAMACIKLFRFEQAEEDCCKALSFPDLADRDRVKALLRRATARDALQRLEEAEKDLKEVLRLEPGNRQAREDLVALRRHKEEMGAATAAMVQAMRQQQAQAAAAGVGVGAGAAGAGAGMGPMGGMLPPGFDPSMLPPGLFPPGFDPSQLMGLNADGSMVGEEDAGY